MDTYVSTVRVLLKTVRSWWLNRRIKDMRTVVMTPSEREEQRRSFAYHNLKLDHPEARREDIDRAAELLTDVKNTTAPM